MESALTSTAMLFTMLMFCTIPAVNVARLLKLTVCLIRCKKMIQDHYDFSVGKIHSFYDEYETEKNIHGESTKVQFPYIDYCVNGKMYRFACESGYIGASVGEQVTVMYRRNEPDKAVVGDHMEALRKLIFQQAFWTILSCIIGMIAIYGITSLEVVNGEIIVK